jgi:predicted nucleic acid-binding protein
LRAVLDLKVLISAVLSRGGAPARVLEAWISGRFELLVSPLLLAELERALACPKLRTDSDLVTIDAVGLPIYAASDFLSV